MIEIHSYFYEVKPYAVSQGELGLMLQKQIRPGQFQEQVYFTRYARESVHCTCPDFLYRGTHLCKHIQTIKEFYEMGNQLVLAQTVDERMKLSAVLCKALCFNTTRTPEQAFAKILIAESMGLTAVEGLLGISIQDGKPLLDYHLILSALDKSERYDYKVIESNAESCTIEFFGKLGDVMVSRGKETKTMKQILERGLDKTRDGKPLSAWRQHPETMLFKSTLLAGQRKFCAAIFGGSIYTTDESAQFGNGGIIDVPTPAEMVQQEYAGAILEDNLLSPPAKSVNPEPLPSTGAPSYRRIDQEQAAQILSLIEAAGITNDQFISTYVIPTVQDLPLEHFKDARSRLQAAAAQKPKPDPAKPETPAGAPSPQDIHDQRQAEHRRQVLGELEDLVYKLGYTHKTIGPRIAAKWGTDDYTKLATVEVENCRDLLKDAWEKKSVSS